MNLLLTTIIVTHLHRDAGTQDLIDAFKRYGNIVSAWIPENTKYDDIEPYGFVQFQNEYDCNAALSSMPPFILNKVVDVHLAKMNPDEKNAIIITGFPESAKEAKLLKHFKKFSPSEIKISRHKEKKSYALIYFDDEIDRDVAAFRMNDSDLDGNKLAVKFSPFLYKSENDL